MIKGNESLVENFTFYFLAPLSHNCNASFWSKPIISGYRVVKNLSLLKTIQNKGIWTLFLSISQKQYGRHPTHSSWCHILCCFGRISPLIHLSHQSPYVLITAPYLFPHIRFLKHSCEVYRPFFPWIIHKHGVKFRDLFSRIGVDQNCIYIISCSSPVTSIHVVNNI